MQKENVKKRPTRMRRENLLKLIEGLFMHFDDDDSESALVEKFPRYIRMLMGQDSKGITSFLENQKIIETPEFKSSGRNRGFVSKKKDVLVNRANLTKLKKYVESCPDKCIEIGETLVWGKIGSRRRSRLY